MRKEGNGGRNNLALSKFHFRVRLEDMRGRKPDRKIAHIAAYAKMNELNQIVSIYETK